MFRFTTRDLLWLTVIVALAVAWWIDRRALAESVGAWKSAANTLLVYAEGGPHTFFLGEDGSLSIASEPTEIENP